MPDGPTESNPLIEAAAKAAQAERENPELRRLQAIQANVQRGGQALARANAQVEAASKIADDMVTGMGSDDPELVDKLAVLAEVAKANVMVSQAFMQITQAQRQQ